MTYPPPPAVPDRGGVADAGTREKHQANELEERAKIRSAVADMRRTLGRRPLPPDDAA